MSNISEYLEIVEGSCRLPEDYERSIEFMLSALELVRYSLAEPVQVGLETAKRYWLEDEKDLSLENAKVALWKHLDSGQLKGPVEAGARAVLCTLESTPPTIDIYELLDWFVQFLSAAGGEQKDIIELMHKYLLRK